MTHPLRTFSCLATAFAVMAWAMVWAAPARAADPIFPIGSRLGMVPPAGMVPSKAFEGFADPDKNAAILLATFPAAAYAQLDKTMVPDALKNQGIAAAKRVPIELPIGKGFLLSGEQTAGSAHYQKWLLIAAASDLTVLVTVQVPEGDPGYPDKAIQDSLATLAVRAKVPDAEQLSLLPFIVGNLAGFRIDNVLPGRAVMLGDPPADKTASTAKSQTSSSATDAAKVPVITRMLIAALPGGPDTAGDQDNFARVLFDQIAGIREVQVQDAEPLRINGQSGYQTIAKAKDVQSDADMMVVQWLRFGTGGFMQMIGMAPAATWPDALTRLRTVRDGISSRE